MKFINLNRKILFIGFLMIVLIYSVFNYAANSRKIAEIFYFNAMDKKDYRKVKTLIDKFPDLVHMKDYRKSSIFTEIKYDTPLFQASRSGDKEFVEYLVSKGARVDERDSEGFTPLYEAISSGNFEIVKFLVSKGANINNESEFYLITPLHWAVVSYQASTPKAEKESYSIIEFLLSEGASPNFQNKYGETALHFAASESHSTQLISLLFRYKAKPDVKDRFSQTPLHFAIIKNRPEAAEILLQNGANPNIRDYKGDTPLHFAARQGSVEMYSLLLKYKADESIKNNKGELPVDLMKR